MFKCVIERVGDQEEVKKNMPQNYLVRENPKFRQSIRERINELKNAGGP